MGCGTLVICRTCKKYYDIGYGSYSSIKERNAGRLAEHKGHDTYSGSDDYLEFKDGNLYACYPMDWEYVLVVENYSEYERI